MVASTLRPRVRDQAAWTYASGLVSALETRLLSQRATLDLLVLGRLDEVLARLRGTLMLADLPEDQRPFELVEGVEAGYAATVRLIGRACPTDALAALFLLPGQWRAFRSYLRHKVLGAEPRKVRAPDTPDAVWEECWSSLDIEPPYDLFARAAAAVRNDMPHEEHDERLIDGITHIYEARDERRTAQEIGSPTLTAWLETFLRQKLALDLLRCRFNEWGHVRAAETLADLGVSRQDILTIIEPQRRGWPSIFVGLGLDAAAGLAEDEPQSAITIERLIDDATTELTHAGRGVPFGPEPVAAFLWGLRMEARNLKLVLGGLAAGLPADAVAANIRRTYV